MKYYDYALFTPVFFCLGTEVPRLSAGSILSGDTACTSVGKEHVLRVRACAVRLATILARGGAKIMQMARSSHPDHFQSNRKTPTETPE